MRCGRPFVPEQLVYVRLKRLGGIELIHIQQRLVVPVSVSMNMSDYMLQQCFRMLHNLNVRANNVLALQHSETQCSKGIGGGSSCYPVSEYDMYSDWQPLKGLMEFCKLTMQANSLFPPPMMAEWYDIALLATRKILKSSLGYKIHTSERHTVSSLWALAEDVLHFDLERNGSVTAFTETIYNTNTLSWLELLCLRENKRHFPKGGII